MKKVAAFFDVDDTILLKPFGVSFAKYLLFEGKWQLVSDKMKIDFIAKMLKYLLYYKLLILDFDELLETALTLFIGLKEEQLIKMGKEAFDSYAKGTISKKILKIIKKHKEKQEQVVLLTSDLEPLMKPLSDYLELPYFISTKLIFENGVFKGKVEKPYCFGEGKTILAKKYSDENDIKLKDCYFYTNSIDDIHFMKNVGHPVAVNPDIKLLIESIRRNWKVINTSKTILD